MDLYYRYQGDILFLLDNNPLLKQIAKKYVERLAALMEVLLGEGAR